MSIGELEKAAGITDRDAFWAPYAKIPGYSSLRNGKLESHGLNAGVAELKRLAADRAVAP